MATFESSLKSTLIYVFAICDDRHKGCLKIGETTLDEDVAGELPPNCKALNDAAEKRINQYTQTAGVEYQLLYTELTVFLSGGRVKSFNDKAVHEVLRRSGVKRKEFKGATEWYNCDLETVKKAIRAVKQGESSLSSGEVSNHQNPIVFRPEQSDAIKRTVRQFGRGNQMLWNAKMRFGKTLCALQVVREMQLKRTLILTHRPVVDEGWFEDFGKIFYDRHDYHYGSHIKGEKFSTLEIMAARGDNYVYFASIQDMRGSEQVGGKFDKNSDEFSTPWDLIIVDEAHEGTQTTLGQAVLKELIKNKTKVLKLSGTPFNLLDEYKEEEIFSWDYIMEQKAKTEWDILHIGESNPYASLPAINIYTYDLGRLMSEYADVDVAFNFREFFRTNEQGAFVHERDVTKFLDLLCKDDEDSLYPFANDTFRNIFRHSLWVLPGVMAAKTLSLMLRNHPVFGNFKVVNVAGEGDEDEERADALQMVNKAIGPNPDETYTITLSCGRLTTGVSVKPWTAVFMLAGSFSTSAANYMQTIFRVQTPFTCNGKMKDKCYAFDFAPDRTLRVLAETAKVQAKAGKTTDEDRKILGDFLNFCPIISIDGSQMKPYDVKTMMKQLKRAQIEKVVQCGFEDGALYNDELLKLTDVELSEFDKLSGVIGRTKAMPKPGDIDINDQGLTNEEYSEKERLEKKPKKNLTPEELKRLEELKERKNNRQNAISILRGISIRMPLLIYGADIDDEDKELTIDNFTSLIDDTSWDEFMPKGVDKETFSRFKKYYEADIFREAGKRIRDIVKAADNLTVEERIERITMLFNTFRNPDKETVLTPWRVVNMHMGDCLGGYCFYDEQWQKQLSEPRFIDNGEVTNNVFGTNSRVMEINSKSGLYPLYVAYSIYRNRVKEMKQKYGEVGHGFAKQIWDTTVAENIFVVCKTPMAKQITRRTLVGFRNAEHLNVVYYNDLINQIKNNPTLVVNTMRDGKHFWKINDNEYMKFNAIVGNPPYQINVGVLKDNYGIPVYNKFIDLSRMIKPNYISMISPSRWFTGGRGLDDFRKSMLEDKKISRIFDFIDSRDCFPTVDISGGINYFLWDQNNVGECNYTSIRGNNRSSNIRKLNDYDVFIRDNNSISIIAKVQSKSKKTLKDFVSGQTPFGFITTFRGEKNKTNECNIELKSSGKLTYVSEKDVKKNREWINLYKVIFSKATCEHAGTPDKNGQYRVISSTGILNPGEICTQSYLVGDVFNHENEANDFFKYIKTKFLRYLLLQALTSQDISGDKFCFVPLQDFTSKSDIDWSKSVEDIDRQLYAKYGLNEEETAFIEKMIKPM